MPLPIIFILFILFLTYFTYKSQRVSNKRQQDKATFLEIEKQANLTRKKSLNNLPLIPIDLKALPFNLSTADEDLKKLQLSVKDFAALPMLNISHQTNTELKLRYGIAHLETLTTYETNYTTFLRLLYQWGKKLSELNEIDNAIKVLEYGIKVDTDISDHYLLLGKLYHQTGQHIAFEGLLKKAHSLDSLLKNKVLRELQQMKI